MTNRGKKFYVEKYILEELLSNGLSNRQIGESIGCGHATVARLLSEYGLKPVRLRLGPPKRIDDDHSLCRKCNKVIRNEDFPYVLNKSDGRRLAYCRSCRYIQYRQNATSTPVKFWNHRQKQLQRNCLKAGVPFEMPDGFLYGLWVNQNGKCFYTDEQMLMELTKGYRSNTASVDKIVPERGYIAGNMVLCTARANSIKYDQTLDEMKLWMPDWYSRIEVLFNE